MTEFMFFYDQISANFNSVETFQLTFFRCLLKNKVSATCKVLMKGALFKAKQTFIDNHVMITDSKKNLHDLKNMASIFVKD